MQLAELDKKAKPSKSQANHRVTCVQNDDDGSLIITIPQVIAAECVHASKTEKAVPMVTLVPMWKDGTPGTVSMKIVVTAKEPIMAAQEGGEPKQVGETDVEKVYNLRIGAFNGFISAAE